MTTFDSYISDQEIINHLCLLRAKLAKRRNDLHLQHLLTSDKSYNYHLNNPQKSEPSQEEALLIKMMPPRRLWIKPNKKQRYNRRGKRINSIQYNHMSLVATITIYKKKRPEIEFLKELSLFLREIRFAINEPNFVYEKPKTFPQKKKEELDKDTGEVVQICRPITTFCLRDRVIVKSVNKHLTKLFDPFFDKHSYAFRSKMYENGKRVYHSHHEAVEKILEYKDNYRGKKLWVAECDMEKFFDSVNHSLIKKKFKRLASIYQKKHGKKIDERAIRLFYRYLDSFAFNKDVFVLNSDPAYWKNHNIRGKAKFGWVEDELKRNHYKRIEQARIGVPQGGALSGLIANMVLDDADKAVRKISDKSLLYLRFCDDMIIIHPYKKKCAEALRAYGRMLRRCKLVLHREANKLIYSKDSFWKAKSKLPYKWGPAFPWVGFLGYEINFDGSVRIRKSTIKKETIKQWEVASKILRAIKNGRRKSDAYVLESFINKLIGMSVGRIRMWNYSSANNDMSWVKAFPRANQNKWLESQLRDLDRSRCRRIAVMRKELIKYPLKTKPRLSKRGRKQKIYYGWPFSYHFQMMKNIKNKELGKTPLVVHEKK